MDAHRKLLVLGGTVLVALSLVPLVVSFGPAGPGAPVEAMPERSAQRLSVTLVSLVTLSIGGVFLFRFVRSA